MCNSIVSVPDHCLCFYFIYYYYGYLVIIKTLIVYVPCPLGVWGRMCNALVSVLGHCFFIFVC